MSNFKKAWQEVKKGAPVAAYFTQDAQVICQATAAAQNATEEEGYYCE